MSETGTIIGTEPDSETKYREEIDNAYNKFVHWKINLFDLPKEAPGKTSEIKSHVGRRLYLWKNKDVEGILNETRTIQKRLPQR